MTKAKKAQMPDAFWQWFDGIRLERNLNDAGMARLTGVDQSTISKARSGERPIGAEALAKMADNLRLSRGFVFSLGGWIREGDALPALDAELARLWSGLPDDDRDEILALLKMKVRRAKQGEASKAGR